MERLSLKIADLRQARCDPLEHAVHCSPFVLSKNWIQPKHWPRGSFVDFPVQNAALGTAMQADALAAPRGDMVPASQAVHLLWPAVAANQPGLQSWQVPGAYWSQNLPTGQSEQLPRTTFLNVPDGQVPRTTAQTTSNIVTKMGRLIAPSW